MDEEIYKPSPWQTEFHRLSHKGICIREALGAGAAGPGKSLCLLMDPFNDQIPIEHERCANLRHPHHIRWGDSRGWALHLRRELPRLEQAIVTSHRIFPKLDSGAKWDAQKHSWTFSSGYRYQFDHCKERNDWIRFLSFEFTWIGFDELIEFEEEQYEQITTRLRTTDPLLSPLLRVRAMSNPQMQVETATSSVVSNPNWVRERFVEPKPEGRKRLVRRFSRKDGEQVELDRIYVPATLYDNPDPEFVRNFEANLLGKPPHIRRAMLYGDWWVTVGSFFADVWNEDLHVIRPFDIPKGWKRFRAMDWGFKNPGVVGWFALDEDDNLYCEREMTFQGMTDAEVADEIKDVEQMMGLWKRGESTLTGPADDQLWEERGDSGKRKADVFAEKGIMWTKADKKSRRTNAERVMKRLKDHNYGTTQPGLVFMERCHKCITTIPGIGTDPSPTSNGEVPLKGGNDHWYDMVSYACGFASHGSQGVPYTEDEWDRVDKQPEDRGQYGYG